MSTMVKRVAGAMFVAMVKEALVSCNYVEDDAESMRSVCLDGHFDLEALARAAIEAMMDPSKEMLRAMFEAMFEEKFDGTSAPMIGAGFEAAIQAALKESE